MQYAVHISSILSIAQSYNFSEVQSTNMSRGEESGTMTKTRLKKLVLNFEKRATKNQELRIKFPDKPVKFLNSEVELQDAVQELRVIATSRYSHLSTFLTNWKKCDSSMFFQHPTFTQTLWPLAASSRC